MVRREFKRYKPISFKQAWLIVLALHAFAFLGFMQWSNYKARLAKEFREAKKAQLLAEGSSKQDWNNQHIKPKILAVAPTPKPVSIKNKPFESSLKVLSEMFNGAKTAFVSTENKTTEEIKKTFLEGKKSITNLSNNTLQSSRTVIAQSNRVHVTSSKPKQTQSGINSKTSQQTFVTQTPSNNFVSMNEPVTISKTTSKTYFADGLDYRTEEQVVQRLSSHIRL
jgi:uncharacterized protein (UPF0333 family)